MNGGSENKSNESRIRRPSPALVLSILALFISLSGSALAIEASIGSKQIKDDSLKSEDLKDGAAVSGDDVAADSIGSPSLAQDSVGTSELGPNAVYGANIVDGTLAFNDIGPQAVGSSELKTVHQRPGNTVTISGGDGQNGDWSTGTSTAKCEAGEHVLAGSLEWGQAKPGDELAISEMNLDIHQVGEGVTVVGASDVHDDRSMRAVAMCLGV